MSPGPPQQSEQQAPSQHPPRATVRWHPWRNTRIKTTPGARPWMIWMHLPDALRPCVKENARKSWWWKEHWFFIDWDFHMQTRVQTYVQNHATHVCSNPCGWFYRRWLRKTAAFIPHFLRSLAHQHQFHALGCKEQHGRHHKFGVQQGQNNQSGNPGGHRWWKSSSNHPRKKS